MAYTIGNKCAKNLCKRTVLLQLIIENVVTCFLEHSVDSPQSHILEISGSDSPKGVFIATQLNSTQLDVELS